MTTPAGAEVTTFLNDDLAPDDADEHTEAMAHDALVYELAVVLMRLDGNEGDPHQLVWCGGPTPEPWGDAEQVLEAIEAALQRGKRAGYIDGYRAGVADKMQQPDGVMVFYGSPAAKPPCAICGTPHEKHGSYPTCASHPYTPDGTLVIIRGQSK